MKKSTFNVIALAILLGGIALPGYTQTDAGAKALLDKVSQTYGTYKTIQADFSLEMKQGSQQTNHKESGTVYMNTPEGKYRISMGNQDIISDGKTQWMVLKDMDEVQVTDVDPSSDAISPTNIFSFYKTGYKYMSSADETAGGKQLAVVEVTPEDTSSPYFKIKLRIDEKTHLIHDVTVFDKGGNRFVYTFKSTKANPQLAPNMFVFKQADYPEMEIVDLR
ncbi:LolA family protein [Parapedobacter soli]|uniref:LolA family protein n=1 Tax=Parapedobacter soli TaxID=416955 RepID=UPI0021C89FD4|nr:outer membrane lipoprotein carrier protein LolA [Parapedobacter soli]